MIKKSAIFSAHFIHLLMRDILIFIGFLLFCLFVWLKVGLHIETLSLFNYKVDKLYIKLDKKFTFEVESLILPSSEENISFENISENLDTLETILNFFEYIDLKKVEVSNQTIGILFYDNVLQIKNDSYLIRGNIIREGKNIMINFPFIYYKPYDFTTTLYAVYDLYNKRFNAKGRFELCDALGSFSINEVNHKLNFLIKSDIFTHLKPIIQKVPISKEAKDWIVNKIKAKHYQLSSFKGEGHLLDKGFDLNTSSLQAEFLASDVNVSFDKRLSSAKIGGVVLKFKENTLLINLKNPSYQKKSLKGSALAIVHLLDKKIALKLSLKLKSALDKEIKKILIVYDVRLPVIQKKGSAKIALDADIALIKRKKANTYEAKVELFDAKIMINHIVLPIASGRIIYKKNIIYLHSLHLKDKVYDGKLNGKILLKKSYAKMKLMLHSLKVKNKKASFIEIKNTEIPLTIAYKKDIVIALPSLNMSIKNRNNLTIISILNLKKIASYFKDNNTLKEGGNLTIFTKDFEYFTFDGLLKRKNFCIAKKYSLCSPIVKFKGTYSSKELFMTSLNGKLTYFNSKKQLNINNLDIDLENFLKDTQKISTSSEKKSQDDFTILGTKSHLKYDKYWLKMDKYTIKINPRGEVNAIGYANGDKIVFSKIKDNLSVRAFRIRDKVLHPLINFHGLAKGRYSLHQYGNPNGLMKGEIIVEGGVMKDFKAYNNTLALINTLPALVALQNPGFSEEGFQIKKGQVKYRMIKKTKIIFDSIKIEGASATIIGKGEINLKTRTIKINLAIQVARKLGEVIGNIPILGYILMGKDKRMTIGLSVSGNLDKPLVQTSATQDILSLPLQLLERTLTSHKHLINQ